MNKGYIISNKDDSNKLIKIPISKTDKELYKKRKKVEKWLNENNHFINITSIEKSLELPKGLIQKFVKYRVNIKDKHIDGLHCFISLITKFKTR